MLRQLTEDQFTRIAVAIEERMVLEDPKGGSLGYMANKK